MKHKHSELIKAWADGAEIEYSIAGSRWDTTKLLGWCLDTDYRIKGDISLDSWNEHKDVIMAYWEGKEIQYLTNPNRGSMHTPNWVDAPSPDWDDDMEYRVKPEPTYFYQWEKLDDVGIIRQSDPVADKYSKKYKYKEKGWRKVESSRRTWDG